MIFKDSLLLKLVQIQSKSYASDEMHQFITQYLDELDISWWEDSGNIYAVKGDADIYPCMVCHTDTVHKKVENPLVYLAGNNIIAIDGDTATQIGTGGDDKVGIFITLKLLEEEDCMKAVFFRDEEVGCKGSKEAKPKFFEDCGFVLQCDRQGADDFIKSIKGRTMYSEEFKEVVKPVLKKFGRTEVFGGSTDVGELRNVVPLCMANMSCGYYNPHKDNEYINVPDVWFTYFFVQELHKVLKGKKWGHPLPVKQTFTQPKYMCQKCGKATVHKTTKLPNGAYRYACTECK